MGKVVWKGGTVRVGGVDLSDHVRSGHCTMSKDQVEDTGLNGPGLHTFLPGLANEGFQFTFASDYDAESVNDLLYPIYRNEETVLVEMIPSPGSVSATNPNYSALCQLFDHNPIDGDVGALLTTPATFVATEEIVRSET